MKELAAQYFERERQAYAELERQEKMNRQLLKIKQHGTTNSRTQKRQNQNGNHGS